MLLDKKDKLLNKQKKIIKNVRQLVAVLVWATWILIKEVVQILWLQPVTLPWGIIHKTTKNI